MMLTLDQIFGFAKPQADRSVPVSLAVGWPDGRSKVVHFCMPASRLTEGQERATLLASRVGATWVAFATHTAAS